MVRCALLALLVVATAADRCGAQFSTKQADLPVGKTVDGLACGFEVERPEYCPGEEVVFHGYLKNGSEKPIRVPVHTGLQGMVVPSYEVLHCATPDGKELIYTGFNLRADYYPPRLAPEEAAKRVKYDPLGADNIRHLVFNPFRFTSESKNWETPQREAVKDPSLRREGEYRLWIEFDAPKLPGMPADGFSGTVRSNEIRITVRDLPVDKRRAKPTPEQQADLDEYVNVGHDPAHRALPDRLKAAVERTENEGLALAIVDTIRGLRSGRIKPGPGYTANTVPNLLFLLQCRSGDYVLRIDGPYLKAFALLGYEMTEEALAGEKSQPQRTMAYGAPLVYLKAHPEDKELRAKTVALAKGCANVRALQPVDPNDSSEGAMKHHAAHRKLSFAWHTLIELGTLHDGMSLNEAVAILGEPTHRWPQPNLVEWYYSSEMHVNPMLRATLVGETLTAFRVDRR